VSGLDMTPEAALTKLYCLLAQGMQPIEARHTMTLDLAGELDPTRS
jgi:L-asparaginase/Glu-tRNA(Gln) amidotransferase subunit D